MVPNSRIVNIPAPAVDRAGFRGRAARRACRLLIPVALAALASSPAMGGPQFVAAGYAVSGYDAVTYQSEARAVRADPGITLDWNGAAWEFASAANRDAFRADPARYAPAYDGHCAYALSEGRKSGGAPELWQVADGRLFLLCSVNAFETWKKEFPGRLARAETDWLAMEGLPAAVPAQPVKPAP